MNFYLSPPLFCVYFFSLLIESVGTIFKTFFFSLMLKQDVKLGSNFLSYYVPKLGPKFLSYYALYRFVVAINSR